MKKTIILLIIIILIYCGINEVSAITINYHDYSDINKLPTIYSYGTLFWTDKTEIINLESRYEIWNDNDKTTILMLLKLHLPLNLMIL